MLAFCVPVAIQLVWQGLVTCRETQGLSCIPWIQLVFESSWLCNCVVTGIRNYVTMWQIHV